MLFVHRYFPIFIARPDVQRPSKDNSARSLRKKMETMIMVLTDAVELRSKDAQEIISFIVNF